MSKHSWTENNANTDDSVWDKETEPELEGKLVKIDTEVGSHASTMYSIEKDDGTILKVWGSTVLDDRFLGVPLNTYVKVTYEGKVKGAKGTYYHNYKVFVDLDSMPEAGQIIEIDDTSPIPDFLRPEADDDSA